MARKLMMAILRYCACVMLILVILGLLEGGILYLQKAHIWILILSGAIVYSVLTWRDYKKKHNS
jgi:ABC-type nickel/cobalt efflux system permease component RcnA